MNNEFYERLYEIEPGTTYMSQDGIPVTALKQLPSSTALFVSEEYFPTPFVIWEYKLTNHNSIELYRGKYFMTLDHALKYISEEV
jgi:hypothetical protein